MAVYGTWYQVSLAGAGGTAKGPPSRYLTPMYVHHCYLAVTNFITTLFAFECVSKLDFLLSEISAPFLRLRVIGHLDVTYFKDVKCHWRTLVFPGLVGLTFLEIFASVVIFYEGNCCNCELQPRYFNC